MITNTIQTDLVLFDHLSVGVYGVPCGWTELRESRNRLSTGVHGGP